MSHPPTSPSVPPGGTDREIPKEVRYFTTGFVFRKLTLREAWLIACGYSLAIEVHIATEHKPGVTRPIVVVNTTKQKDPKAAMNELGKKAEAQRAARLNGVGTEKVDNAIAKAVKKTNEAFTPPANPTGTPIPFPKEK